MSTESKWAARVEAWKRSGEAAPAFCVGKGYEPSTLRYWASRLRHARPTPIGRVDVRVARVVRGSGAINAADSPIVIEHGRVRIGLRRGFDRDAFRAVLDVLEEREVAR